MVKSKTVENIEPSAARLTVSVAAEDCSREYKALLAEYARKAHIKGFRPGKAPVSVLESKFGESLKFETAEKVIEKSLKTVFDELESKPLGYESPRLTSDLNFDPSKDFEFTVEYDVYPEITIKEKSGLSIEVPQAKVEKEDLERELQAIREQNALTVDKGTEPIAKDDIVTIDTVELDEEGKHIEPSHRSDFTFTVGSGYNKYQIDDEIVGLKAGDTKEITKTYSTEESDTELAGRTIRLSVKISKVKRRDLPALDDELAQDIDDKYKTLDDLKKDVQKRLEESLESALRQKKISALVEALVEKNTFSVPASMVNAELHQSWHNFVNQLGGNENMVAQLLTAQGSSPDKLLEEWRPAATNRLRGQLLVQKLLELEKVEATDEEVQAEIITQTKDSNMDEKEAREYFEKNNLIDYVKQEIRERKLFDALLTQVTIKKGPKVKYLDLMKRNS